MGPGLGEQDNSNQVYMLDAASGEVLWDFTLDGGGGGSMSVAPAFGRGNIYFGGQGDSKLYAVDAATGEVRWHHPGLRGLYSCQLATVEDNLYVPDEVEGVVLFEASSGRPQWGNAVGAWGLPVALRGDTVFAVGPDRDVLLALDANTGEEKWRFNGLQAYFTWLVAGQERVYANLSDTEVVALYASDGKEAWREKLSVKKLAGEAALADGNLFVTIWHDKEEQGGLAALDAETGDFHWYFPTEEEGALDVAVANKVVYFTGWQASTVFALDPESGDLLWSGRLDRWAGDLAIADGMLYVEAGDTVYAFGNEE
jgi:outer membrane protein assembly factor BamB